MFSTKTPFRTALVLLVLFAVCVRTEEEQHPKRAPSGFTGVRGKKSVVLLPEVPSAYSTYIKNSQALDENNGAVMSPEFKTGSITAISDVLGSDGGGRGGARGAVIDKRAPSGFMGMRGKKPYYGYAIDQEMETAGGGGGGERQQQLWGDGAAYPEEVYNSKRAPSGFMGMRGKKDMEFANYNGDDYIKRAPSGFMGMRGKKDYDYYPASYPSPHDLPYPSDKRAPMGFVGMRGKKEFYLNAPMTDDKRAPSAGFFGMRGKKQPRQSAGFFGMRGKKFPYEFRGKFVGVRGKKQSNEIATEADFSKFDNDENVMDLGALGQDLDLNQLMLLLTENKSEHNDVWNVPGGSSQQGAAGKYSQN